MHKILCEMSCNALIDALSDIAKMNKDIIQKKLLGRDHVKGYRESLSILLTDPEIKEVLRSKQISHEILICFVLDERFIDLKQLKDLEKRS